MPSGPPSWTEWGSWSTCSQSCGGGEKHRERTCNSKNTLSPVHDVHTRIVNRPPDCPGSPRDTKSCHNQDCPGRDYKRDILEEFNANAKYQKKYPFKILQSQHNGQCGALGALAPNLVAEENRAEKENARRRTTLSTLAPIQT